MASKKKVNAKELARRKAQGEKASKHKPKESFQPKKKEWKK